MLYAVVSVAAAPSSASVLVPTTDCPAGIAALVGRMVSHPSLNSTQPAVVTALDALCYDTLEHTSQLDYTAGVSVGKAWIKFGTPSRWKRVLHVFS